MFREAMKEKSHDRGNQHTGGKCYNVTEANAATGNGKAYTLSRLKRESPELFAQVVTGGRLARATVKPVLHLPLTCPHFDKPAHA
jgi:hypothetical protein